MDTRSRDLWSRLGTGIPLIAQLRGYGLDHARGDFIAGLTTAVLLIPQATAYAMLAGLPPELGLLASTWPLLIYAVLGSSAHLSVGPVAMVSIVVARALSQLAEPGSDDYLLYAAELALLAGVVQLAMGALRFGFIADLLSHPVMMGFAAAAALLIMSTQLGAVTGLSLAGSGQRFDQVIVEVATRWREFDIATMITGAVSIVALLVLKRGWPRLPRALMVLAGIALLVYVLPIRSVAMVGEIPSGLPSLSLPRFDGERLKALLPTSAVVVLVGFVEAYAVARVTAREAGQSVQPDRELAGLGAANVAAALAGAYPVGGAFSRTAVNARAGARTNLASVVTAGVVMLTLLYFTPVFAYVPRAGLAAIIIVAVSGLIDWREIQRFWSLDKRDFGLAMLTFAATLVLGVRTGITIGVVTSIAVFVMRVARPKVIELSARRRRSSSADRERTQASATGERDNGPSDTEVPGVLVLRVQAPAFFANARYLNDQIIARLEGSDIHTVIVDAAAIDHLDASAELALGELLEELERRDVVLRLARATEEALSLMDRSGLLERLEQRVHTSLHDAIESAAERRPGD